MRNKTTNIYTEWLPLIESLPDDEAGKVFKSILKYQNGDDVLFQNSIWLFIKTKIDEYNQKLCDIKEKRRISGSYGGLAKASKCYQKLADDSKDKQNLANLAIKENKIKENENINEIINKLKNILVNYHKRDFSTRNWRDSVDKMLRIDKIPFDNVIKCLDWYEKHIGEDFVPVIASGSSLREKYVKLENAMKKKKNTFGNWSDF